MKIFLKWVFYIILTLAVARLIPFQSLSDYIGSLNLSFIGEGEEAYNNCDLVAFIIQITLSIFIAFIVIKIIYFTIRNKYDKNDD